MRSDRAVEATPSQDAIVETMLLPSESVRRIYEGWAAHQPPDAPTFAGDGGNLFFADDDEFWLLIERANTAVESTPAGGVRAHDPSPGN